MKRALVIVLDSVGCGKAADAAMYGDEGADTLGHLFERVSGFRLDSLGALGLYELLGVESDVRRYPGAKAFRLNQTAAGKDTTTGHWELMGYRLMEPLYTCERFEQDLVGEMEELAGTGFLGNKAASGTEILEELGELHCETGKPILYTSADSVLQIAAHEEVYGLERLLGLCRDVRELLDRREEMVGRVIARPFLGGNGTPFRRTSNRHDYSLVPQKTVLNELEESGVEVVGVGKIRDIFAGSGVSRSYLTKDNLEGMERIMELWQRYSEKDQLVFANLVDFDSRYGHRRDSEGYAECLREFDRWLCGFLETFAHDGLVIITADHGNDPYHSGTDHTREQVPCFVLLPGNFELRGEMSVFSDVAGCLRKYFEVK